MVDEPLPVPEVGPNPIGMPSRRGLLWALGLLLLVWPAVLFSVLGQWASSGLNVGTASLTAYATVQIGGNPEQDTSLILGDRIKGFLGTGKTGIMRAVALALALIAAAGVVDTFVAWTLTWGHIRLLRQFTLAAIRSTLSDSAGSLDASTAVQRWLVKSDVNNFLLGTLTQFAGLAGTVVIAIWATFKTDASAGATAVAGLGAWLLLACLLTYKAVASSRWAASEHERLGSFIRESARLRDDLRRPSLVRHWLARSEDQVANLRRAVGFEGLWGSMLYGLLSSIGNAIPLAGFLVVAFTRDLGASVAVYLYLARLTGPLGSLAGILPMLQTQLISIQRVHDGFGRLLRAPLPSAPSVGSIPAPVRLEIQELSVAPAPSAHPLRFPFFEAVGITCVVGDSGSGKTTLLRTLAGILPVDSGSVRQGHEEIALSSPSWLEQCYLLPQQPELIPPTLAENLWGIPGWGASGALAKVLLRVGSHMAASLQEMRALDIESLSVGYRRTIAVCRCLGSNSPILLLDEPFAGLDQELAQALARLLEHEAESGRLIVLALHRHEVSRTGLKVDRLVLLER